MNRISVNLLLAAAVLGSGVAALLTSWIRVWAQKRLLDVPNERSSHVAPTPRGGGLAVVAVVIGGVLLFAPQLRAGTHVAGYVAGALLIAIVSFIDDVRPVSFRARLLVHSAAALIAIGAYTGWQGAAFPLLAWGPGVAGGLTFLWIVGLTNAYNFMDGIDGLAGVQAVISGLAWCIIGFIMSTPAPALIGLLAAAASAGFLLHNWPPARIFMGDVGSAFLGYTFAVLPLMIDTAGPSIMAAGMLIVGLFVFDTVFTFLRRLAARENVFLAHRSHLYQRLTTAGRSHRTVTLLYAVLASALAGAAVIGVLAPRHVIALWLLGGSSVSATLLLTVQYQEARQRRRAPIRGGTAAAE
jgi:UDP-N-acetylmuramyl pentapeptide phosphotransferase/UDP-N-acetylglucosamine-1-phosphate transferase